MSWAKWEAKVLEAAIAATVRDDDPPTVSPWASRGPDGGSIAGEIDWLRAVAWHFQPSPRPAVGQARAGQQPAETAT